MPKKMICVQCGFVSSNTLCKACILLEGLNSGTARQAMGRKKKTTPSTGIQIEEQKNGTQEEEKKTGGAEEKIKPKGGKAPGKKKPINIQYE